MNIELIHGDDPAWSTQMDRAYQLLSPKPAPLLPRHFVQTVLSKIGGKLVFYAENESVSGVGFLCPRGYEANADDASLRRKIYTLRYHPVADAPLIDADEMTSAVEQALGDATLHLYLPLLHAFSATSTVVDGIEIGQPSADEAAAIPQMQQQIWRASDDDLYPADVWSQQFGAGTLLVARVDGQLAGFLCGFYKFGGSPLPTDWLTRLGGDWRLESQIMGVLPEFRGRHVAVALKKAQAQDALRDGICIINWTADPLQWPNACLNFGVLGAIAFEFVADLYQFRNELNQVPPSRFSLTWLVDTPRVQKRMKPHSQTPMLDLRNQPSIARVNQGWQQLDFAARAAMIAFEIPANWTALQNQDVDEAARWRDATDRLFAHYIGYKNGQYVVTGVGVEGDRHFLIAERARDELWARLGN